uniref:Uncharacterized protein n=1 Tax=Salix viminalis TaxID=40686 RepID=A0A6N2KYC1_SALVM
MDIKAKEKGVVEFKEVVKANKLVHIKLLYLHAKFEKDEIRKILVDNCIIRKIVKDFTPTRVMINWFLKEILQAK